MKNRVSVIIPCYNALPYLAETLSCTLNQTYQNIEIIIIDDYSTDNSFEYVNSLKNSKIICLKNREKGANNARNYGLEIATGEYIQFLDADDLLSKDKIEKQVNVLNSSNGKSIASCSWVSFIDEIDFTLFNKQPIDKTYLDPINWLVDSWNGKGMYPPNCWLMPRGLIECAGLWNKSLLKNQDGEFMSRIICHSTSIIFVENIYAFYRKPQIKNVSRRKDEKAVESVLKSYKLYEEVLKFKDNKTVRSAIGKNYNNFIYRNYNLHPDLAEIAVKNINYLGLKVIIPFSSRVIRLISLFLDWRYLLKFRYILKRY